MQTSNLNDISAKQAVPKLLMIITVLGIAFLVQTIAMVSLTAFVWKKKTESFAVSETGRVVPLVPLDKPYVNDSRVSGFAEECLRSSFSHDYENYRLTMNAAKNCYTSAGAKAFEAAMDPMLDDIKNKRVVMSSSMEPTVVVKSYILSGAVHWETQTPMTLYRRGTREQLTPIRFLVTTVVERVPLDENVRGISVRSINLKPMST
ncbi:DotI/IcmL family type IV secretion protein [Polaromonas sp.]|uniref:DotI/IcmL family type IV secretion protein n=1 Tax=Polaromonas sp. TaxID=1869339 RepID=UPI00352B919A